MEQFNTRGIGRNSILCFVCGRGMSYGTPREASEVGGQDNFYYTGGSCQQDMAAFVESQEAGARIVDMFDRKAYLDYRAFEPNRVQVKVGACKDHEANLMYLGELTMCGFITKEKIELARNPKKELYKTVAEERLKSYMDELTDSPEDERIRKMLKVIQEGFDYPRGSGH